MNVVQHKIQSLHLRTWISNFQDKYLTVEGKKSTSHNSYRRAKVDLLSPLRKWLDNVEIKSSQVAHRICQLIPSQCPFEREVRFFGRTLVKIPPMCKLNPNWHPSL